MMKALSRFLLLLAALSCAGISSFETLFAPRKDLWDFWFASDPSSQAVIEHEAWSGILERYLVAGDDGINRFAYGRVSAEDRAALTGYLDLLASIPVRRYSFDEQLPFWINLYNALTVKVVLDHYPVASIRDIDTSPGLFADGPWGEKLFTLEGQELSLNDIEHRILRPIWDDPKLHYAVNCASLGCPNLQPQAFTLANSEALLEQAARDYVNSARGTWDSADGLAVSSIYAWFPEDFGKDDPSLIEHLKAFARPALREKLETVTEIADHGYDWRLNDAR